MKVKVSLFIIAIVMVGTLSISISAQTEYAEQYPSSLTVFINNLKHNLNIGLFSVVGDDKSCGTSGGNPNKEWTIQTGQRFNSATYGTSSVATVCGSGMTGLYDVFTNGWTPWVEFYNGVDFICNTGPCHIQLYCCPSLTCSNTLTISCTPESGFYRCPRESGILYDRSSYEYCPTEVTMTCYYRDGDECEERTYDKSLFPNNCEDYTYNGRALFSSLSGCGSELGECLIDSECPSNKPDCKNGVCVEEEIVCIPDCSCASNTCIGEVCSDGCGGSCPGTKDCNGGNGDGDIIYVGVGETCDWTNNLCLEGLICTCPDYDGETQCELGINTYCVSDELPPGEVTNESCSPEGEVEVKPDGIVWECVGGKWFIYEEELNISQNKQISLTRKEYNDVIKYEEWDSVTNSMCNLDSQCFIRGDYEVSCKKSETIWKNNQRAIKEECEESQEDLLSKFINILGLIPIVPEKMFEFGCSGASWIGEWKEDIPRGTCRASSEGDLFCDIASQLAFFEMTGDDCIDGLIITIIGGFLIILLIKR